MLMLRGHHLLCLHGFRGLGYNQDFAANMQALWDQLRADPLVEVMVTAAPDDICSACPHLLSGGCAKSGEESEARIAEKDRRVLEELSVSPGDALPAKELFLRTAEKFRNNIQDFCPSCEWLHLGWCAEGLNKMSMSLGNLHGEAVPAEP